MNFLYLIFWGWYRILDNTVYVYKKDYSAFGIREHAFFIAFLLHGINIWTLFRYTYMWYFGEMINVYLPYLIFISVFAYGYCKLLKTKKADAIITSEKSLLESILLILITLTYSFFTGYFMIEVGNYIRIANGYGLE